MNRKWILLTVSLFLTFSPAWSQEGCFSLVAGRDATADGGMLLGHNEDCNLTEIAGLWKVAPGKHGEGAFVILTEGGHLPQAAETFGYWHMAMPNQKYCDAVLNEHGLVVFSNSCPSREDKPEFRSGGIGGPTLRLLVAERARTARQGVELLGRWVEQFGYTASGRTMIVADTREAWLVSLVRGKHWAAARVPDDRVAVIANTYSLCALNLEDEENFLACPDLIDYAVQRGWYDPESGPFSFEAAYAAPGSRNNRSNTHRQWSGMQALSAETVQVPEKARLPFSVTPKEPMTLEHFTRVLRDHYETTPYYQAAAGYAEGTPHKGHASTICCPATNSSSVFQLRPDLPLAIGAVWWNALWQPCSSPYLPLYLGMDRVPEQLAFPEKADHHWGSPAYTLFGELARWVDEDYGKRIVAVRARWASLEKAAREFQPLLEKMMLEHPEAMDHALGVYCQGMAARAMEEAQALMSK